MAEHGWRALQSELDAWADAGGIATFWWRDDDAGRACAALERLLRLQSRYRAPLALAVVPERLDSALPALVRTGRGVCVLQHGFAHRNHAGAREKSMELGAHRPRGQVLGELHRGFTQLASECGKDFLPVLVPPWNRIAEALLPGLPPLGLHGLSTFRPRSQRNPVSGLRQVNCHVDLIDWRGGRGGRDHTALASEVADHLHARRAGRVDAEEPTGLLTHHLDHDGRAWEFVERLLERVADHPAAHWSSPRDLFDPRVSGFETQESGDGFPPSRE